MTLAAIRIILVIVLAANTLVAQTVDYYIPVKIAYFPGHKYKIPSDQSRYPYELSTYEDIWINVMNYPLTNPSQSRELFVTNRELYNNKAKRVLFEKDSCGFVIENYVHRVVTKIKKRSRVGEGLVLSTEKSGDKTYWRCVCIPATELISIPHVDFISMGDPAKYFKPEPFVKKFSRYRLDSLDLREAPYFTIFPMDIQPSFDCSKARTLSEKSICRSAELSKLDRQLSQLYQKSIEDGDEKIRESQRNWMKKRDDNLFGKNDQEAINLLIELYKTRLQEFENPKN